MAGRSRYVERLVIETGLRRGLTCHETARDIGRSVSTLSREIARNGSRRGYAPGRARCLARRPRQRKLVADPELAAAVQAGLLRGWSPQQAAGRLRLEHPHDPRWHISHETIYQALCVQGRGGLRPSWCESCEAAGSAGARAGVASAEAAHRSSTRS